MSDAIGGIQISRPNLFGKSSLSNDVLSHKIKMQTDFCCLDQAISPNQTSIVPGGQFLCSHINGLDTLCDFARKEQGTSCPARCHGNQDNQRQLVPGQMMSKHQ